MSYLNNNKGYPKFESMGIIDNLFLEKMLKNKLVPSKKSLFDDNQEYIIFYPRLGNWKFSIGNSREICLQN